MKKETLKMVISLELLKANVLGLNNDVLESKEADKISKRILKLMKLKEEEINAIMRGD